MKLFRSTLSKRYRVLVCFLVAAYFYWEFADLKVTLTNLYNALEKYRAEIKGKQRNAKQWADAVGSEIALGLIEELDEVHRELDEAVLAAYGWPANLGDEQILTRLLALNLARANRHE